MLVVSKSGFNLVISSFERYEQATHYAGHSKHSKSL